MKVEQDDDPAQPLFLLIPERKQAFLA